MERLLASLPLTTAKKRTTASPTHVDIGLRYEQGQGAFLVVVPTTRTERRIIHADFGAKMLYLDMPRWSAERFAGISPSADDISILMTKVLDDIDQDLKNNTYMSNNGIVQAALNLRA